MTYARSLLHTLEDERACYTEPLYSMLQGILIALINVEHPPSRQQAEAEAFWRLVEVAAKHPSLVAPAVSPPTCEACRERLAEEGGEGRGTDRVAESQTPT